MSAPATPEWITPSAPGQLSNTRGSNLVGDALPLTTRYRNPSGSEPGQARFTGTRIATTASGQAYSAQSVWDTGWIGTPTLTNLPVALRLFGTAYINDRLYITGGIDGSSNVRSEVWSAPAVGGSLGTWRQETPMSTFWPAGATASSVASRYAHACCAATFGATGGTGSVAKGSGGVSWLIVSGGVDGATSTTSPYTIAATINADGTLGPWQTLQSQAAPLGFHHMIPIPNQYVTAGLLMGGGLLNSGVVSNLCWAAPVKSAPANSTGWLGWTAIPGLSTGFGGHRFAYDWANGVALSFRGSDGTTNQIGEWYLPLNIDIVAWAVGYTGSWTAVSAGGGTARNGAGLVYTPSTSAGGNSYAQLIGGHTSANLNTSGTYLPTALSSIQKAQITWSGGVPSFTWNASAVSLPAAATYLGAALGRHAPDAGYGAQVDADVSRIYVLGGGNGTNSVLATALSTTRALPGVAGDISAFFPNVGSGLTGAMGTAGSVVGNSDGSYDTTIYYGAPIAGSALADGDQIQVAAQFTNVNSGDVSPISTTLVKVGQPPSLSAISPANAATPSGGQPPLSFNYLNGAGGEQQYSYRIQLKQASTVVFDTGVRYDSLNSAVLSIAPLLAPSTTYTLIITATSLDTPISGASNSVTSTTTFTTTAFTVLGVPGSFTATASGSNANVAFTWGAVGSATGYNLYYRRTAVGGNWYLYAATGNVTSYTAADHLALGIGYDFAVSTLSAVPAESARSTTQAATIPTGGYSAYLHVAGQATGVAFQIQGSPTVARKLGMGYLFGHGQGAPTARYGTGDYVTLSATGLLIDSTPASLKLVQGIINAVQAGGVCFYRDALGGMLVMAFDPDQGVVILPPWNREIQAKLTEVNDLIGPYVSAGSAQGYLTLSSGRKPPLDTAERLL